MNFSKDKEELLTKATKPFLIFAVVELLGISFTLFEHIRLATVFYSIAIAPLLWLAGFQYSDFRKSIAILCLGSASILLIWSFSFIYSFYGLNGPHGIDKQLSTALYFSIVTWTTLGYGDFSPSPDIRLWAAAEALLGYFISALFIAFLLKNREPLSK